MRLPRQQRSVGLANRFVRSARVGRLSPRRLFVDPSHRTSRACVVAGSTRSGTTKLAETLSAASGVRLICEPLNTYRSPVVPKDFVWGQYVPPGSPCDELQTVYEGCLTGRLRDSRWLDQWNRARIVRHRLVKSTAGTNLIPWLTAAFPDVPFAFIVRHPFAVGQSVAALYEMERRDRRPADWHYQVDAVLDDLVLRAGLLQGPLSSIAPEIRDRWHAAKDPFDRSVLRWCLENHLALTTPPSGVRVVFFEDLFTDPAAHLPMLAEHLRVPLASRTYESLDQPSRTDRYGTHRSIGDRIADWTHELEPAQITAGLETLELFGLHHYYGTGMHPIR